jgi:hypothetical protein
MADDAASKAVQEMDTDRNAVAVAFIIECAKAGVRVRLASSGRTAALVTKNGKVPPAALAQQLRTLKPDVVDYLKRKAAADREAQAGPACPYEATRAGIVWRHGDRTTLLSNFTAAITATVIRDDGTKDPPQSYELTCTIHGTTRTIVAAADQFDGMTWVRKLGPRAIIEPGTSMHERLRAAMYFLSEKLTTFSLKS